MIALDPQEPANINELKNDLKELSRAEALIVAGGERPRACGFPIKNVPNQCPDRRR